jgi:short chain dehydrogenase
MTLEGQTLFISGGSRGIGLAIALRAARDGANVALIAKTAEPHPKLEGTVYTAAAQIEAAGGHALPVVGDIRDEAQVERAVAQAVERFGGIDVCVNNASAINLSGTEAVRRPRLITSLIIQERLHRGGRAFRVRGQLQVAAAVDVQLAARYQPVHDPRVDQRDDRIVVTGQDQGRRPQLRQPRQAGPAEAGEELVDVTPGRAQAGGGVQQVPGQGRVVACAAPVQLAGDAARVSRVPVAARREHVEQDARMPGTISAPVPVATSTRRRTRSGRLSANCCASPPPQEMPRTSACS